MGSGRRGRRPPRGLEHQARECSLLARRDAARGRTSQGRSATDFALIESDAAERTETKSAAQSVLVGYLDSESSAAVGALRAIKIQQGTEYDADAKDSRCGEGVAVRDFEVLSRSATQNGNGSKQGAHQEESSRLPRACSEVLPDRHGQQSYTSRVRNITPHEESAGDAGEEDRQRARALKQACQRLLTLPAVIVMKGGGAQARTSPREGS